MPMQMFAVKRLGLPAAVGMVAACINFEQTLLHQASADAAGAKALGEEEIGGMTVEDAWRWQSMNPDGYKV